MESNQQDQGTRLRLLIKTLKLNQVTFAQSLGMSQPNISRMINGENKLSAEVLNRITRAHKNVNVHWLITGEGPMFAGLSAAPAVTPALEPTSPYVLRGKGRLEEMEERIERLEAAVRALEQRLGD